MDKCELFNGDEGEEEDAKDDIEMFTEQGGDFEDDRDLLTGGEPAPSPLTDQSSATVRSKVHLNFELLFSVLVCAATM